MCAVTWDPSSLHSTDQFQSVVLFAPGCGLAAAHGDHARADKLFDAVRSEQLDQAVHFDGRPGHFDHQRRAGDIDDSGPIDVGNLHDFGALWRRFARDFDQRELALEARVFGQVTDLAHLNDFVELLGDLLDGTAGAVDDHGQAHDADLVGAPDAQAFDGKRALAEQTQDPIEDHWALFDGGYQGVFAHRSLASFALGPAPASTRSRVVGPS